MSGQSHVVRIDSVSADAFQTTLEQLNNDPRIEYAEPDLKMTIQPNQQNHNSEMSRYETQKYYISAQAELQFDPPAAFDGFGVTGEGRPVYRQIIQR